MYVAPTTQQPVVEPVGLSSREPDGLEWATNPWRREVIQAAFKIGARGNEVWLEIDFKSTFARNLAKRGGGITAWAAGGEGSSEPSSRGDAATRSLGLLIAKDLEVVVGGSITGEVPLLEMAWEAFRDGEPELDCFNYGLNAEEFRFSVSQQVAVIQNPSILKLP